MIRRTSRTAAALAAAALLVGGLLGCDSEGELGAIADPVVPPPVEAPAEAPGSEAPSGKEVAETKEAAKAPPPKTVAIAAENPTLLDKTFDDVKFDIEPDSPFERSMLTEGIRALDGQRMRIRGYILPTAQKRGIKQFVLVRDNQECCFGPGAALYDCILVNMEPGETTEFTVRPVAVEGVFTVDEFYGPNDEIPLAIYRLKGARVN